MDSRKIKSRLINRRHSYPPTGVRHDITTGLPLDEHLICDKITQEIFRYPILASDGHRYEARTFLLVLQNNARSAYDRDHIFSHFTYDQQLKNNLDKFYGEHKDRCADYDIAQVIIEIKYWIEQWNNKDKPIDYDSQLQVLNDSDHDSDSDSADVNVNDNSEAEIDDDVVSYRHTFLAGIKPCQSDRRISCLFPPVSFWPRQLNNPVYNAVANSFIISEPLLFCLTLCFLYDEALSFGNIRDSFNYSLFASSVFSLLFGVAINFSDLNKYISDRDAQVLRM